MRLFLGAIAAVSLACSPVSAMAAPRVPTVQVTTDQFSKDVKFFGPLEGVNPFGGTSRLYRLRTWVNKETKTIEHQLYVDVSYIGGWRWYQTAADETAQDLKVLAISSNVSSCSTFGCSLSETVGIDIDDATLRVHASGGLRVKLNAKSGDSLIIELSATQVRLQVEAVDRYLGVAAAPDPTAAVAAVPGATLGADLGADFDDIPGYARSKFTREGGALLTWVKRDSVAARAGMKWADAIVGFGGAAVIDAEDLSRKIAAVPPGTAVAVKVVRARKELDLTARF
jgi:hypothetical protein